MEEDNKCNCNCIVSFFLCDKLLNISLFEGIFLDIEPKKINLFDYIYCIETKYLNDFISQCDVLNYKTHDLHKSQIINRINKYEIILNYKNKDIPYELKMV